jgi:hypothetical protein
MRLKRKLALTRAAMPIAKLIRIGNSRSDAKHGGDDLAASEAE